MIPSAWREDGALEELEKLLQSNWEQRGIFYFDKEISSRQQFIDFDFRNGFKTRNYIGTITFRGEQLLSLIPSIRKLTDLVELGQIVTGWELLMQT